MAVFMMTGNFPQKTDVRKCVARMEAVIEDYCK
jgi:hypothetical protein